jgi:dCTP deaminase
VILQTEEEVAFPARIFGLIMPKVTLLQQGIANTPTKIDPGYHGRLLITAFNHGKRPVQLKRGERFCSMFLQPVGDGIRPYKKDSKQLTGEQMKRPWQRLRDLLEANIGAVTAVLILATLLSTTVSVTLAVLYFLAGIRAP